MLLSLGLAVGCVDPEDESGGSTGGTSLYVFDSSDSATSRVLIYSDASALFDDPTIQPSRRLSGNKINTVKNLAWGGMCFDSDRNMLYMVSEAGDVVRIDRVRSQNGDLSSPFDIVMFRLGDSDSERLANGKFGQAAIDSRDNVLYVTEANNSDTRIWVVGTPGTIADGSSVSSSGQLAVSGDRRGTGVAAHNGSVYAFFEDGAYINNYLSGVSYAGPRLRKGASSGFQTESSLIIGDASDPINRTMLARYGSLAIDQDGHVYLARHLQDASIASGSAILYFKSGQFWPGMNEAPDRSFAAIDNLRVISHSIRRDWLVGALSNGEDGGGTLWMWRSPSAMGASAPGKAIQLNAGVSIRGLALDGSN